MQRLGSSALDPVIEETRNRCYLFVKAKTELNRFSERGNEYSLSPNAWNFLPSRIIVIF
jgi:hypothetical protein